MTSTPPPNRVMDYLFRRDHRFALLHFAFAGFVLVAAFLTWHHNPWRDEAQAWLMARSLSPWGLFLEARHEEHPILWHLCLKSLQLLGAPYPAMMVLNLVFVVAAIWLLFYRSGLPLVARLVFAFSPACVLDISYNARNYAIALLLYFVAAMLYRRAERKPLAFCGALALLANTNIFATAAFLGISLQFLLEQACDFGRAPLSLRPLVTRYLGANLILAATALFVLAQLAPVPLPGDPQGKTTLSESVHNHPGPAAILIWLAPALLIFFRKTPGFPRIAGGVVSTLLATVPLMVHSVASRHYFMLVGEVVFFVWIYYDDLIRAETSVGPTWAGQPRVAVLWTTLIGVTAYLCLPWHLGDAIRQQSDSTRAARAVLHEHLDRPDALLYTTVPTQTTSLMLYFQHLDALYVPRPFPPGPLPFPDYFYTQMLHHHYFSLAQAKPEIMALAQAHPSSTILLSGLPDDRGFDPGDSHYRLVHVYQSAVGSEFRPTEELYQIYALEPVAARSP